MRTVAFTLLVWILVSGVVCAQGGGLEVFPQSIEMQFPDGYEVRDDTGKVLKRVAGPTSATIKAKSSGKAFAAGDVYLSDWSYDQLQKGKRPNWVVPSGKVAPASLSHSSSSGVDSTELVVYPTAKEMSFPDGYNVVSDAGRLIKSVPGPSSASVKAERLSRSSAGRISYLSDWSFDQLASGKSPNWIIPIAPPKPESDAAASSKLTRPEHSQSKIEGANKYGATWAYEFVNFGQTPTISLATDHVGLVVYADESYVVNAVSVAGDPGRAAPVPPRTELLFYDTRSARLLAAVSVPNWVFRVGRLKQGSNIRFYAATVGSHKTFSDHPVALTLLDVSDQVLERVPIGDGEAYFQTRYSIRGAGRSILIDANAMRLPTTGVSQRQPSTSAFNDLRINLSFAQSSDKDPSYEYANSHTVDEDNWNLHTELLDQDPAALAYLPTGKSRRSSPQAARGQFAVETVAGSGGGLVLARAVNGGRLHVFNFGRFRSETFGIAASGASMPHVFPDGTLAAVGGGSMHIISDASKKKIDLPAEGGKAIMKQLETAMFLRDPNKDIDTLLNREFAKLMYSENQVGLMLKDKLLALDKNVSSGFKELEISESVKTLLGGDRKSAEGSPDWVFGPEVLHQRSEVPNIIDWDISTGTYVVVGLNPRSLLEVNRIETSSGKCIGENEFNIQTVYEVIRYSEPSSDWRARSFVSSSSSDGLTWGVMLESEDGTRSGTVARFLGEEPNSLAIKVTGDEARVLYGAVGKLELIHSRLPHGSSDGDLPGIKPINQWSYSSLFGSPFVEAKSGTLFVPGPSGFEVWSIWQDQPSKLFDLVLGEGEEYAVLLPVGIYSGSPGCESLLRLKAGDGSVDGFSIAQWRNRPAEVLMALGGDPEVIEVLAKLTERWHKRIGFDPANPEPKASDLPKVSVPERPSLWAKGEEAAFSIEWQKGASPLRNVIVRVNGVESARLEGDALSSATEDKGSVDATVKLAEGQNWIEVTAEDVEGRRSDLQRFRTILKDSPTETKRYIIALGVSDYAKPELNLQFAAKDAKDLLEELAGKGVADKGLLAKIFGQSEDAQGSEQVLLLTNDQVDRSAVEKIREFVGKSSENDEVILFCAGHGVLDDKLDYYYAGHDFDPDRPSETGIKLDDLVGAVSSAKALKRLMLLDTCHAGVVGEKDEMLLAQMDTKLPSGVRAVAHRGMKVQQATDFSASDKQRFIEEMFSLPGTIRGVNIIGASAGAQFALESEQWNNGVFTASVVEGLRDKNADWNEDGRITVSELKNYLGQRVSELTAGAQKPSVVAFEQDQDFDLLD